ncbi:MAG: hypothetical protein IPQ07_21010 [Myxococcales bacterium]|nr:hypothetical protein [Myxococcales bacterium]
MRTASVVTALLLSLPACSAQAPIAETDAGPIGECTYDHECSPGKKCDPASHTCSIGGCGGQLLDLTYVQPNLELVLDRSCSMRQVLAGTNTTKWTAAVGAIDHVLSSYADKVRWGSRCSPTPRARRAPRARSRCRSPITTPRRSHRC